MLPTQAQYERSKQLDKPEKPSDKSNIRPEIKLGAGIIKKESYFLISPERPVGGSMEWTTDITLKGGVYKVECQDGTIMTKEPEVRDFFQGQGWILEKTKEE